MRNYPHPRRLRRGLALQVLLVMGACAGSAAPSLRAQTEGAAAAAVVDGKIITLKEVDGSVSAQILPLQQQMYAIRKRALENLILRAILEGEAAKRKISVEELRKQLTAGEVSVSPSQVEQLYLENISTFAAMSPDEARERLRLDIEAQARMRLYRDALSKLKESSAIELRLGEPRLISINTDDTAPSLGAKRALVIITEFSDFQCPYCKSAQATIKRILHEYVSDVKLTFRHLPLMDIHPQALPAARAAFCAGQQGSFWQFHDALFSSDDLSPEAFSDIATRLGIDLPKFKICIDSEVSRRAVFEDIQEAKRLGISGTPTFIINGTLVRGVTGYEDFKSIIERELKSARGVPATQHPQPE